MSDIKKISHITLICKDIDKTGIFLKEIFGAIEHYANDKNVYSVSKERFFKAGDLWMVTMEGEPIVRTYNHIAFEADITKADELRDKLVQLGLEVLPGRKRTKEEGDSIYFYDYDGHLFELHSGNLDERLKYYRDQDSSR